MTLTRFASNALCGLVFSLSFLSGTQAAVSGFDHSYKHYSSLLEKHVHWIDNKKSTAVDYASLKQDREDLKAILNRWSAVSSSAYEQFSREQKMAFLINAYNGFTLELILTEYPDLNSIKELGGFFSSPWKKEFFTLLGQKRTLDWIEHEQLRPKFQDPRIHAAVNCASIGCPALLPEAYTASKLDQQMENSMQRFLSDQSRNRVENGQLKVSQIFDWFSEDFEQGFRGADSVKEFLALYAEQLSDNPAIQNQIKQGELGVSYLDYDWKLNDLSR
ncbi:MAG: DUF547 domain-containing protein [Limnobacter sp.]|nr:DUF547 domain-containing protein [Limnobacter sp.]